MRYIVRRWSRRTMLAISAVFAVAFAGSPATAKDAQAYVESAQTYAQKGNFKAAEIELRNATREAPQDGHIRALLAEVYLKLHDFATAEREARTARDLKEAEPNYLLILGEAMLGQGKFADILAQIKPGDRDPKFESKVRLVLAAAAGGVHDRVKTESLLREAVSLDPNAIRPKIALARLLLGSNPAEAEKLVDDAIAAEPRNAEGVGLKGEVLALRGDRDGAMRRFEEALQIDGRNILSHLARANINLSRNDYAAVDKDIDLVLGLEPQNFGANYLRALENLKKQDFAAADKILERLSPNFAYMPEGLYVQAATKYGLKQYGQAADAIAKYVARVPGNPFGARLAAMIAMQRGAPDAAIGYLNTYLAKSSPDPRTLTLLGNAYVALGNPSLALQQYQKAAELAPHDVTLKTIVAASEIDAGSGRKGLEELEKVFDTTAGTTAAGPTLVLTELRAGHISKAATAAEKLVKTDGERPGYQVLLGMVRIAQHDYSAAETIFRALLAKNPDYGPAVGNLANIYVLTGRTADAKKVYKDLLDRDPNALTGLLGLADLAASEKNWDDAIGYASKARSTSPSDPTPALKLFNLYFEQQNWSRARALASELAIQFPTSVDVFEAQGRMLAASGDQTGSIDAYRRAYEIAPNSAPILAHYLAALAAAKRFSEEKTVLQARLDKDPANRGLKADLIRVEAETGGLDAAVAKARAFAKTDPGNSVYDLVCADLYERAGKRPEAMALLENAVRSQPADAQLTVALSSLYNRAGDLARAEAVLSTHLEQQPNDMVAQAALADFYIQHGKYAAAISAETRVLSRQPDDLVALNNLAWLYQQVGDLAKAREYAEKATAMAPTNGSIEDTLGWIMVAQGDSEKALTHLRAANAANPRNPEVAYHLAVALGRAGRSQDARTLLEKLLGSNASFGSKQDAQKLLDELKKG